MKEDKETKTVNKIYEPEGDPEAKSGTDQFPRVAVKRQEIKKAIVITSIVIIVIVLSLMLTLVEINIGGYYNAPILKCGCGHKTILYFNKGKVVMYNMGHESYNEGGKYSNKKWYLSESEYLKFKACALGVTIYNESGDRLFLWRSLSYTFGLGKDIAPFTFEDQSLYEYIGETKYLFRK